MKKQITILVLLVLSVLGVNSQTYNDTLVWAPSNAYPAIFQASFYNSAVVLMDKLYAHILNGLDPSTTFQRYTIQDPSLGGGNWVNDVPLPEALVGGSMVACDGLIYYIGGSPTEVTVPTTLVYCFDPTYGTWTAKAPLPVALSGHGAVCWGDSVIFVMGGPWSSSEPANLDVYYYRPSTNTWGVNTGLSGLPSGAGRRTFAIGIDGNKIIIAGGWAGSSFIETTFIGTIGSNATQILWGQVPNIPNGGVSRCGGSAINGKFFVVGGEKQGGFRSDTTHVFDFASNSWMYSFPGKPVEVSNVSNAIASIKLSGDTIVLFSLGGYSGLASCDNFDVAKFYNLSSNKIEEQSSDFLTVYPNPTKDYIAITTNIPGELVHVQICNAMGQVIESVEFIGQTTLNLSSYSSGLYILKVIETGYSTRFVKQ